MMNLPDIEADEIIYPSSDGKPIAENDFTRNYLFYCVDGLNIYFRKRPNVYVSMSITD